MVNLGLKTVNDDEWSYNRFVTRESEVSLLHSGAPFHPALAQRAASAGDIKRKPIAMRARAINSIK